jgi:ribosomal protein S18 acetylase RimI-like enzyme
VTAFVVLFASASLARRIERAEATLIAEFGRTAARHLSDRKVLIRDFAGGIAVAAGPGAPYSKIAGLGFEPIDVSALDALEQRYTANGTPVRVELPTLANPEIGAMLTRRGYTLEGFENVLGLALPVESPSTDDISVARAAEAESTQWTDVLASSFAAPDVYDGPSVDEKVDRSTLDALFQQISEINGFVPYLARRHGEVAGAGGMRLADGIAQLCGAGTLPAHRRRGVQTALLHYRLADAARAGCDIAIVTTQPGSVSQQNVQRQGFEVLYARAILIKPI